VAGGGLEGGADRPRLRADCSGITIELSEDPFPFDDFATVATAVTDVGSGYSFTRTPTVNTRYQTRQGATTSRITTVGVRPSISLRVSSRRLATGRSVTFSGRVLPGARRRLARDPAPHSAEALAYSPANALADLPGSRCSSYARRLRVRRSGVYRTFLAAHADHADGSSRKHRIDVP
jgi:hypothetical protein